MYNDNKAPLPLPECFKQGGSLSLSVPLSNSRSSVDKHHKTDKQTHHEANSERSAASVKLSTGYWGVVFKSSRVMALGMWVTLLLLKCLVFPDCLGRRGARSLLGDCAPFGAHVAHTQAPQGFITSVCDLGLRTVEKCACIFLKKIPSAGLAQEEHKTHQRLLQSSTRVCVQQERLGKVVELHLRRCTALRDFFMIAWRWASQHWKIHTEIYVYFQFYLFSVSLSFHTHSAASLLGVHRCDDDNRYW